MSVEALRLKSNQTQEKPSPASPNIPNLAHQDRNSIKTPDSQR